MKECNCHRGPEVGQKIVGCPPKVINIRNPQEPVLFHRVDVPAAMGDDITDPPVNGRYKNVLLVYEANDHIYLYNSDGIPTSLTVNTTELEEAIEDLGIRLAQEADDRLQTDIALREDIDQVAEDLEEFKNSPDVVDIVATYADLQVYDTSALGDKDEIRVLRDETHEGASAYYRWDKTNSQWIFIGITGPYYTKSEIDTTIQGIEGDIEDVQSKIGQAKALSSADYNWNSVTMDTTEPYNSVALWRLDPGLYTVPNGVSGYICKNGTALYSASYKKLFQITPQGTYSKMIICWEEDHIADGSPMTVAKVYGVSQTTGDFSHTMTIGSPIYNISSPGTSRADVPLAASVGHTLNRNIGDLSTLTTTNKNSAVAAINEVASGLSPVVQATGTSTTDVMSQNAASSMIFADPGTDKKIKIGSLANMNQNISSGVAIGCVSVNGANGIAIGPSDSDLYSAKTAYNGVAIGSGADASGAPNQVAIGGSAHNGSGEGSMAIGTSSYAAGENSVALGRYASASQKGELNVGTGNHSSAGYNNTTYRLISGVYNPQSAHDAATKGYVDNSIPATFTTNEWNALWA